MPMARGRALCHGRDMSTDMNAAVTGIAPRNSTPRNIAPRSTPHSSTPHATRNASGPRAMHPAGRTSHSDTTRPSTLPSISSAATPCQPTVPILLHTNDLPGPLSLSRLSAFGTVNQLDEFSGYWSEHANTLYGRAAIVAAIAPFGTVACTYTAAWVWLGGDPFPNTIDVISTSHFRSSTVGRRIRVFKRLTLPEQILKIGSLTITTPARTACDLVMAPESDPNPSTINALVCQLMSAYEFQPDDCLQIVKEHRHHKYAARAKEFFTAIQREIDETTTERYS